MGRTREAATMATKPLVVRVHFYLPGGQGKHSLASAVAHAE